MAFGKPLAEQGTIRADIAESRMEIEQARLLTLKAAHLMDTVGNKAARGEIAMIKVVVPSVALRVIDRAIQAHGAAGVSDDFPLAAAWAHARTIRLADGPDEVHREAIAKLELRKYECMRRVIAALVALLGAADCDESTRQVGAWFGAGGSTAVGVVHGRGGDDRRHAGGARSTGA